MAKDEKAEEELDEEEEEELELAGAGPEMMEEDTKEETKEAEGVDEDEEGEPLLCPECGKKIQEEWDICPFCRTELSKGEDIKCSVCGEVVPADKAKCPVCGTKFLSDEEVEKGVVPIDTLGRRRRRKRHEVRMEKEEVEKPKKKPKKKAKKKAVKKKKAPPKARRPVRKTPNYALPAALVSWVLVMVALYVFVNPPITGHNIDGDFRDWEDELVIEDPAGSVSVPALDIIEYSAVEDGENVHLFIKTEDPMFGGSGSSPTLSIFFDTDHDSSTGYLIRGLGADAMVEIAGTKSSTKLQRFIPLTSQHDWAGWSGTGKVDWSRTGSMIEISVSKSNLGIDSYSNPRVLFSMTSASGDATDFSRAAIGLGAGGVVVTQNIVASTNVTPGEKNVDLMLIEIEAVGEINKLGSLKFARTGDGPDGDAERITLWSGNLKVDDGTFKDDTIHLNANLALEPGKTIVLKLTADVWEKASGKVIGAEINSVDDITVEKGSAILATEGDDPKVYYIDQVPDLVSVDGAFADWSDVTPVFTELEEFDDPVDMTSNPSIDIIRFKTFKRLSDLVAYNPILYVETKSDVFTGDPMPGYKAGTMTGYDELWVYFDIDHNGNTGHPVGLMGAEYAFAIKGKYGEIVDCELYEYSVSGWDLIGTEGVTAMNDWRHVEFEVGRGIFPQSIQGATAMIELMDGSGRIDSTDSFTFP